MANPFSGGLSYDLKDTLTPNSSYALSFDARVPYYLHSR